MSSATGHSAKILIIEDHDDARLLMYKALSLEGYPILQAASGAEALTILENENDIGLLLVDLSMPGISGAELIQTVRRNPRHAGAKIIVVSGWDDLAAKAREAGADGYLRKPIRLESLYKEVEKHLSASL